MGDLYLHLSESELLNEQSTDDSNESSVRTADNSEQPKRHRANLSELSKTKPDQSIAASDRRVSKEPEEKRQETNSSTPDSTATHTDGQINSEINNSSGEEYEDSIDMAEQQQREALEKINTYWDKYKIAAPRITVGELSEPQQWSSWKFKITTEFERYKLNALYEIDFLDAVKQSEEYKELNRSVIGNIGMNLSEALRNTVMIDRRPDAHKVWKSLIDQFEGKGTVQTIRCFTRITSLLKNRNESEENTIAIIKEVKSKFDANKDDGEALWKAILVNSLPANEALQTILSTQPESKTLEELCEIVHQSQQLKAIEDDGNHRTGNKALVNTVKGKANESSGSGLCYECNQPGHFKRQCEQYKRRIKRAGSNGSKQQQRAKQSGTSGGGKKFKSNHLLAKISEDEEVLELNPKSFFPKSKVIYALTYKPENGSQGESDEQSDHEDELLDLNPRWSASSQSDGHLGRLQLSQATLSSLGNFKTESKQAVEKHVIRKGCCSPLERPEHPTVGKITDQHTQPTRIKTIADSGCNSQMFKSAEGMTNVKAGGAPLYTASSQQLPVDCIGDKTITTSLDEKIELKGVIVSSKLNGNFLSIPQFDKSGYRIEIFGGKMSFFNMDNKIVMIAELDDDDLYEVKLKEAKCNVIRKPDDVVYEWHVTLSHIGIDSIKKLRDRLELNIPENYRIECTTCLKGKMIRSAFDGVRLRADRPLKIVHTDLSGIIRIANRQNYRYFLIFVDDFSRQTFLYLLKSKQDVFENFREFKAMIEKQLDSHIKRLKSDGGTEYDNHKFDDLCKQTGMLQQFTAPRCPQQNGSPERMNRTIEQMARCLLIHAGLSVSFWPFAVLYAVFIKNRVPHKAINGQIPLELFYNTKVDFSKIRKFGSQVIYLIDDREITKFDPTGEEGLFLGVPNEYSQGSFYVYSMAKRKVIVRRHVYFVRADEHLVKDSGNAVYENSPESNIFEADQSSPETLGSAIEQLGMQCIETEYEQMDSSEQRNGSSDGESAEDQIEKAVSAEQVQQPPVNQRQVMVDQQEQPIDQQRESNHQSDATTGKQKLILTDLARLLADRPKPGDKLMMTINQKQQLLQHFPDMKLDFVNPVNRGHRKGAGVYKVNAVQVPRNVRQIGQLPEKELWNQAMQKELESMEKLQVWEEVDRPRNKKVLPLLWVFRVKFYPNGQVDKHKARLCVLGNLQDSKPHENVYSPVLHEVSFRTLLSFGVHRRMHMHHVDVQTAYLYSDIFDEVYVDFPQGMARKPHRCLRLRKSLYGLRSSPQNWYNTLTQILLGLGFRRLFSDRCVFIRRDEKNNLTLIGAFVDDLMLLCDDEKQLEQLKIDIGDKVAISDKGVVSQFLNLEIHYDRELGVLKISQKEFLRQILDQFGMADCNGKRTVCPSGADLFGHTGKPLADAGEYMSLVGVLIYASIRSRPDLKYIVSRLCQFMSCPTEYHMTLARHVLQYIKQTLDYALYYTAEGSNQVQIDCDADFANDKTTSRSITGVSVQMFGNLVEWVSRKQSSVAGSTCHAELQALGEGIDSLLFMRGFLDELIDVSKVRFTVFCDNQSALQSSTTSGKYEHNKSHRILVHRVMETLEQEWVEARHKSTGDMVADFLTKPLKGDQFYKLLNLLNVF